MKKNISRVTKNTMGTKRKDNSEVDRAEPKKSNMEPSTTRNNSKSITADKFHTYTLLNTSRD